MVKNLWTQTSVKRVKYRNIKELKDVKWLIYSSHLVGKEKFMFADTPHLLTIYCGRRGDQGTVIVLNVSAEGPHCGIHRGV